MRQVPNSRLRWIGMVSSRAHEAQLLGWWWAAATRQETPQSCTNYRGRNATAAFSKDGSRSEEIIRVLRFNQTTLILDLAKFKPQKGSRQSRVDTQDSARTRAKCSSWWPCFLRRLSPPGARCFLGYSTSLLGG